MVSQNVRNFILNIRKISISDLLLIFISIAATLVPVIRLAYLLPPTGIALLSFSCFGAVLSTLVMKKICVSIQNDGFQNNELPLIQEEAPAEIHGADVEHSMNQRDSVSPAHSSLIERFGIFAPERIGTPESQESEDVPLQESVEVVGVVNP